METINELFDAIWRRQHEVEAETPVENRCLHAKEFAATLLVIVWPLIQLNTLVALGQAKVILLDKYFEWRSYVPKSHRFRVAETGHICIWHVFEECYRQIKFAELALAPPKLYEPPHVPSAAMLPPQPPPIPPPPAFGDVFVDEPD